MAYKYNQFWRRRKRQNQLDSVFARATLSNPVVAPLTDTTADVSADTDFGEGLIAVYVSTSPTAPDVYEWNNPTLATLFGVQPVTATGTQTIPVGGLSPDTTYYVYFVQKDDNLIYGNVVSTTLNLVGAPTLSSLVLAAPAAGQATADVSTDDTNGLLYWFVSTSATPPSLADLKAGTGATQFSNQAVTAAGAQPQISVTGLAPNTYHFYLVHEDANGNNSNIITDSVITT